MSQHLRYIFHLPLRAGDFHPPVNLLDSRFYCTRTNRADLLLLQVDGPEHQVRQLLKQLGKDEPLTVKLLEEGKQVGKYPWHAFKRQRNEGKGSREPRQGYGFEQPQFGPIALGYAAHFGLGIFVPVG